MSKTTVKPLHFVAATVCVLVSMFGLLFTWESAGCCMLGKSVSTGLPIPYKTTSYHQNNTEVYGTSFDNDSLVIDIMAWATSSIGIVWTTLLLRKEPKGKHA